jgi:hypothetical protein
MRERVGLAPPLGLFSGAICADPKTAEAALELAEMRLKGPAPVAFAELEAFATSATSEQVRLGAARDLVDRSVGKARERIHVAVAITVKRPWSPPSPMKGAAPCRHGFDHA